ncbi:hypothetical protein GCM10027416_04040 [Okibacterium endophyticum]
MNGITPASGPVTGGATLTIDGTALDGVTGVTVGGQPAGDLTLVDDGTLTVVTPPAADYQPASAEIVVTGGDAAEPLMTLEYAYEVQTPVDAQMQYAFAHWQEYNSAEWGNLNPVGGDCANFVSQTLIQRGWTQSDAWYNRGAGADWSSTWGYAPAMDDWFASDASLGLTRLSLEQRDQVKVGDIGMFDWNDNATPDHVMVVSSVSGEGADTKIAFVSHNLDGQYRDLDNVITVEHPGGTAWFWSVP